MRRTKKQQYEDSILKINSMIEKNQKKKNDLINPIDEKIKILETRKKEFESALEMIKKKEIIEIIDNSGMSLSEIEKALSR